MTGMAFRPPYRPDCSDIADAARFAPAFDSLDGASDAVRELHEGCCQLTRRPRSEHLAKTIDAARSRRNNGVFVLER